MSKYDDYETEDLKILVACSDCMNRDDCKQTKESMIGCIEMLNEDIDNDDEI